MSHKQSPPEERIYQATWQDGSIDLFAGLVAAAMGVAWILDWVVLGPFAPAIAIPLWIPFRRRVIEPRLGHVRFDDQRQGRLRRAHVTLIGIGCATLLLGVGLYFARGSGRGAGELTRVLIPALPSALLAFGCLVSAIMFAIPRLALYAVPFMLGGLAVAALDTDPGWGLLAGGVVTALYGAVLLTRFLRAFPRLSSELE